MSLAFIMVSKIIISPYRLPGIRDVIALRQDGLCRKCRLQFSEKDTIVSSGQRKKYYHQHCAEQLNII
jgi:hypothetical protein